MTTAYQGDKPYVFLSYSHKDEELALSVIEYLQEHSFNVWYDEGIHSGTQWKDVILKKIANPNCWMMVFLVTQNSLASKECRREIVFADKKEKKFLNVVIGSPQFPDWFICDFDEYQRLDEEKFPNRKAMLDKLNSELIWHQRNTDKPTDTAKETPKAPWVCKNCGSNNSGDDDVCEVCGSSDRYVAPKETPAPSPTEGLKFSIVDGTATVTGYTGSDTKVIIPAKITSNGKTYKVTSIGERAFKDCKNTTSITIPNSITSIGKWAFERCENLTSITIPDSVTSIGSFAFLGCENIISIVVDENNTHYKSIDGNLYSKDGTILIQYAIDKTKTSFTIPDHVTTIGDLAFFWCKNLTSIDVDKNNTHYKSIDGNLYSKDDTTLIQYAIGKTTTSFTIPNSITTIGVAAFVGGENLTSITIPNSVTSIGDLAFGGCTSLTSITIPNSVTSIGYGAFYECKNLTIYCEAKSKPEGWHTDWNSSKRPVIWGYGSSSPKEDKVCGSSKLSTDSITTPKPSSTEGLKFTVTDDTATVSDYRDTDSNVIIPAAITYNGKTYKVTAIGECAFYRCENITSITIPDSVTSIGKSAFAWCKNLTSITIPNSVTSIGVRAFEWCENLTSITIPNSVTSIGESAFSGCSSLTSITIPNRVTTIGESAFRDCTNLTSITIPDSVTTIGDGAFTWCKNLTSIAIPNSVTTIGESAFYECKNLTSITIPDSVTTIGDFAFWECSSLTSITIPNSVTSIGVRAFEGCTNLTSITIPNSVTSIGVRAFWGCDKLTIYCEAKSKPEGWHFGWHPHNRPVVWNCGSSSPKEDEVCGSSKPSTDSTTT